MEITRDEVRVMTVHGAKGLEAPIVILADTITPPAGRTLAAAAAHRSAAVEPRARAISSGPAPKANDVAPVAARARARQARRTRTSIGGCSTSR